VRREDGYDGSVRREDVVKYGRVRRADMVG
jgi:hypothetical protein